MSENLERLMILFDHGGPLLWVIVALSVLMWTLMWTLILERYLTLLFSLPALHNSLLSRWRQRALRSGAAEQWLRETLTRSQSTLAGRNLGTIRSLTHLLPLVGLLGTVSGMIKVFTVITLFGMGNSRGLAAGISEALVTTMAGLLTALTGLFAAVDLESRIQNRTEQFTNALSNR